MTFSVRSRDAWRCLAAISICGFVMLGVSVAPAWAGDKEDADAAKLAATAMVKSAKSAKASAEADLKQAKPSFTARSDADTKAAEWQSKAGAWKAAATTWATTHRAARA